MCPCTKFQLIWRASDFGTKFAQKSVSDKNFGKINIRFEMRIQPCNPYQILVDLENYSL